MIAENHRHMRQQFPLIPEGYLYLSHAIDVCLVATALSGAANMSVAVCRILGL